MGIGTGSEGMGLENGMDGAGGQEDRIGMGQGWRMRGWGWNKGMWDQGNEDRENGGWPGTREWVVIGLGSQCVPRKGTLTTNFG